MMAPHEYVNEAAMSTSFSAHLIVEGNSDYRLVTEALKGNSKVNVIVVGTSDYVVSTILEFERLSATLKFKMLGLIDQDYRIPLRKLPTTPLLVLTELRDIECMMWQSAAYDRVVKELSSPTKLSKRGDTTGSIKKQIVDIARRIGEIRFCSQKHQWNLTFRHLDCSKFVDKKTFVFSEDSFVAHINGPQTGKRLSKSDLPSAHNTAVNEPHFSNDLLLCRGHDLMALLALGMARVWGSGSLRSLSADLVERMFRSSYVDMFRSTATFKKLDDWITQSVALPV